MTTYQTILLEDFLALCRELNGQDCDFPTVVTPAYFDASSSCQNLVSKADSDGSNTVLVQQFLGEVDEFHYPCVVCERVVFYMA